MSTPLPNIHLNGTASCVLLKDYRKAVIAVTQAIEELSAIEFNSRDYSSSTLWDAALVARQTQFRKLHDIKRELEDVVLHIMNGGRN